MSKYECARCGRSGTHGFTIEVESGERRTVCQSWAACYRRQRSYKQATADYQLREKSGPSQGDGA